jgi:hypothetical protein
MKDASNQHVAEHLKRLFRARCGLLPVDCGAIHVEGFGADKGRGTMARNGNNGEKLGFEAEFFKAADKLIRFVEKGEAHEQ